MIDEIYAGDISRLSQSLARYQMVNRRKWEYYDGEAAIKNIGLAVPQSMVNVDVVLGWPEIVVDALDERLDWLGWSSTSQDIADLKAVYRDNRLAHEFNKAKIDALVTGVGFLEVSQGGEGEPEVIINAVSSQHATYVWDDRAERVEVGLVEKYGDDGARYLTLYYPDRTVTIRAHGSVEDVSELVHNRGVAGLVPVANRTRASDTRGRSEITKPIRYYTDHGVRTLLGMEYNREIYTTPQRWYKNVFAEDFGFSEDDSPSDVAARGVKIAMNRTVIMEPNITEDGDVGPEPATGQYQSAPPTPYIEQLKMLSQLCSAQSGVPSSYFGFHTENPPSADAIRALEARLVKKAERRQTLFDWSLLTLARIAQTILSGQPPSLEFMNGVTTLWRDASTPTRAAAMDSTVKAIGSGLLDQDSSVALEAAGFTPDQIERIQQEKARSTARRLIESIQERQGDATTNALADGSAIAPNDPEALKKKADAMGVLIRAGVKPESAAEQVGLGGLTFWEGRPVTLKYNDEV